jgi:integrase
VPTPALSLSKHTETKVAKYNDENERVKHTYFEWEKEANGKSDATIANMRKYIYMYEEFTGFKSFKQFCKSDAMNFKKEIAQKHNKRSKEPVSKSFQLHALKNISNLFKWLATQPGYKKRIDLSQVAYLNLSNKDIEAARAPRAKRYPTIEQIERVVKAMPAETDIHKRNRALIAFLALTGCRVTAITSLKIKHFFLEDERIEQHPSDVKTKFSKNIQSFLLPINDYLKTIFKDWVRLLKEEKMYDGNMPLFPNTKLSFTENDQFNRAELDNAPWKSTTCIRSIVKEAFNAAGLEYYNPHSFRNSIVDWGYPLCKSAQDFKALSQNLGHNNIMTTFTSYGTIDERDQGRIIKRLGAHDEDQLLTKKEFKLLWQEMQRGE